MPFVDLGSHEIVMKTFERMSAACRGKSIAKDTHFYYLLFYYHFIPSSHSYGKPVINGGFGWVNSKIYYINYYIKIFT